MKSANSKFWIIAAVVVAVLGALVYLKDAKKASASPLAGKEVTVYRTVTCGCCKNYISYLENAGLVVKEELVTDIQAIKAQNNIPSELASCHTTVMDGYVVEGHIPTQVMEQLAKEKPSVRGIALPGMPQGSPGMPGVKAGSWAISSFTDDGQISTFTSY